VAELQGRVVSWSDGTGRHLTNVHQIADLVLNAQGNAGFRFAGRSGNNNAYVFETGTTTSETALLIMQLATRSEETG